MKTALSAQLAAVMRNIESENIARDDVDFQPFTLGAALNAESPESLQIQNVSTTDISFWNIAEWSSDSYTSSKLVPYERVSRRSVYASSNVPYQLQLINFDDAPSQGAKFGPAPNQYNPKPDELENALSLNQITLLYEPTVDLASGRIVELEAIPYLHHANFGLLPLAHIDYCNNSSFVMELANWAFSSAGEQILDWRTNYAHYTELGLSATMCKPLFDDKSYLSNAAETMSSFGLKPNIISAQIPISDVLADNKRGSEMIATLKDAGFKIGLNLFDAEIDAISAIRNLPVRTLKLSPAFTANVGRMQVDPSLSRSVIGLAKSMNLRVVATGVETAGQLKRLRSFGCDIAQGPLFSKPLSAEEIGPLLNQRAVFFQLVDAINDISGGY